MNYQMFKHFFRKGRGTRDQIANIHWIIEKAREFQKNIYFCFIYYAKDIDCVDHNKLWKIMEEMGIPDHLSCLLRNLYAGQEAIVRTGHGTTEWFQKEYINAVSCHCAYVTYMQNQFGSVAQSCLTFCDPMNCSTPGLPVHHQLPESTQTYVDPWCHPTISSSVIPFSSCPQSFPTSGSFPRSQLFASGSQSIGVSASTSVLPMNTQD